MFLFERQGNDFTITMPMELSGQQAEEVAQLYDLLQEDEDVEEVYTNAMWEGKE